MMIQSLLMNKNSSENTYWSPSVTFSPSSSTTLLDSNNSSSQDHKLSDALRSIPIQELQTFARAAGHLLVVSSSSNNNTFDWKQLVTEFGISSSSHFSVTQKILLLNHVASSNVNNHNFLVQRNRQEKLKSILLKQQQEDMTENDDENSTTTFSNDFTLNVLLQILTGDSSTFSKDPNVISFIQQNKKKKKRNDIQNLLLLCTFKIPQLMKLFSLRSEEEEEEEI